MDRILTPREAALMIGVSERLLRKLRTSGKLSYIALSKRLIRYSEVDCYTYLQSCRRRDEPCPPPSETNVHHIGNMISKGTSGGFMARRAARKSGTHKNS